MVLRRLDQYPAIACGTASLLALTFLLWTSGALSPTEVPAYATSRRQIIGMSLMLIAMPSYFVVTTIVVTRRSMSLLELLRSIVPDPRLADDALASIRNVSSRRILIGSVIGLGMGAFNFLLYPETLYALLESRTPSIDITHSLLQFFLWWIIGVILWHRLAVARSFARLGEIVSFDIFQLDRLRPLARAGMNDVLLIAGAVALSPLQALDAEFRLGNYSFALLVAIPTSLTLLAIPLRPIHRRIVHDKKIRLARIEAAIERTRNDPAQENLADLEALLSHRDRLHDQPTWPFSTALASRLVFYLVIPPIAWVGAAFVEQLVTQWFGSSS